MTKGDGKPMLEGVRVLDLTSVVFGPYATQLLVDLGADVIKVEEPKAGDAMRWSAPSAKTQGLSPVFLALNHGKRSVALDLKAAEGKAHFLELVKDADVLILNQRANAARRLGLDYESIREVNPDIIYAHCVGFGQSGPYADHQAFDDIIQAASGLTTLLSKVDGNPDPRYLPSFIVDKVSGLYAAQSVLAAIIHKLRTGEGQAIEIPMMEAFSAFLLLEHLGGNTFIPPNGPGCYKRQIDPDRQPFPAKDGAVSIVAYTDDAWPRLFKALGDADFLNQEKFATRRLRFDNMESILKRVKELTQALTVAEIVERCRAERLPAQAVRSIDDMLEEPHLKAVGFFKEREHPTEGRYVEIAPPVRFSAWTAAEFSPPAALGQHEGARWADKPA